MAENNHQLNAHLRRATEELVAPLAESIQRAASSSETFEAAAVVARDGGG